MMMESHLPSVVAGATMIPVETGQKLHDRATRREALTAEEQKQLRMWYAQHDQEETMQLSAAPVPSQLADLETRVQQVSGQVVAQAQHIEAMTAENTRLRQEIATLQRLLSEKLAGQPV
jgi:hypothetical protein